MKIFITGINGQLGADLRICAEKDKHIVLGCGRKLCDSPYYTQINLSRQKEKLDETIKTFKPDVIIHCAAWTAVDLAEIEQKATYDANVTATQNVVEIAKKYNCKLVYISTDYVYGANHSNLIYEDEQLNPLSYYRIYKNVR